jgi:hypothetical protein
MVNGDIQWLAQSGNDSGAVAGFFVLWLGLAFIPAIIGSNKGSAEWPSTSSASSSFCQPSSLRCSCRRRSGPAITRDQPRHQRQHRRRRHRHPRSRPLLCGNNWTLFLAPRKEGHSEERPLHRRASGSSASVRSVRSRCAAMQVFVHTVGVSRTPGSTAIAGGGRQMAVGRMSGTTNRLVCGARRVTFLHPNRRPTACSWFRLAMHRRPLD